MKSATILHNQAFTLKYDGNKYKGRVLDHGVTYAKIILGKRVMYISYNLFCDSLDEQLIIEHGQLLKADSYDSQQIKKLCIASIDRANVINNRSHTINI